MKSKENSSIILAYLPYWWFCCRVHFSVVHHFLIEALIKLVSFWRRPTGLYSESTGLPTLNVIHTIFTVPCHQGHQHCTDN